MRISDVGNTVVYTRGLSEYILLVNGKSQVGIWLRNWVARVGMRRASHRCADPHWGRDQLPRLTLVVALFFCFVPGESRVDF
jgi:hypothetical protein